MLRHRFLTALATPAGPSLKTASRSLSSAGCSACAAAWRQALRQRRVVAGEAGAARRDGHGGGDGAHLGGGRLAELVAARGDVARPAADVGCPGLEGPLPLLDGRRRRARRRSACSCSMSACTGSNQDRVMPSRRVVIGIAHAAPRVVERAAPGARGRAAAAAARFLARHLAVGPAHDAVELAAHGIEPRGDDGAGIARILLQAGKAGARRLLAGDQAPPEAVAEADRPDREEHIERKGDEPLAPGAAWRRRSRAASATSGR